MIDYDDGQVYNRDYADNFSIKEFALNDIMPKYFPDDTSHLAVGLEGMVSEYIGTVSEDAFNAASTYLMETFPSRAQFASSIYAHAAIFQLSNAFSKASSCDFLVLLNANDVKKNLRQNQGDKFKYFYIDKDTIFTVEDKEYCLDYDIMIKAKHTGTKNGIEQYIYSARYITSEYKNCTSNLSDPYIKVRLSKNGYIGLKLKMHQVHRRYIYKELTDNSNINYPTVRLTYSGYLAGLDVLYKAPGDSGYNTQLQLQPVFSQPSRTPFCYYKKVDDETIILSFTTKDGYFQPEFNSELLIVLYQTEGEDADFDEYTGTNISISKTSSKYQYNYAWGITAKPIGSSYGAKNAISQDGLKELTIEGFTTANALTTMHDLEVYFNNFKNRYKSEVLFMKKRDDAVERLFSAFLYFKKDDYIYPSNTLTIDTNIMDLDYKVGGYYVMDPGYLFGYKRDDAYFLPIKYWDAYQNNCYYAESWDGIIYYYINDEKAVPEVTISKKKLERMIATKDVIPGSLKWYKVSGQNYTLYDKDGVVTGKEASTITEEELLTLFVNKEVSYGRVENSGRAVEFLTDIEEEAKQRRNYLDYKVIWERDMNDGNELTYSEYVFNYSFDDYKNDMKIDNRISVFDDNFEEKIQGIDFVFTNPFLTSITKSTGSVGYYLTNIDNECLVDFIAQNDDDAFMQFVTYTLKVSRKIGKEKKYLLSLTLLPSVSVESEDDLLDVNTIYDVNSTSNDGSHLDQFIHPITGEELKPSLQNYNKTILSNNNLRVILSFYTGDRDRPCSYMEMIPTNLDADTDQITFESVIETDDFITIDNTFRIVHRCPYCGEVITNSANKNIDNYDYYCPNCGNVFKEGIINMEETDDILLPITGAEVGITVLYKDPTADVQPTNNSFHQYDDSYKGYQWTNKYMTTLNPVTFIEPLNMVRGIIQYQDYYLTGINALDCYLYDVPMMKYSILAYRDEGMTITDPLLSDDIGKFHYFMKQYKAHYEFLANAKETLRNATNIDIKFYNTYGRSSNFSVGDEDELIDTNNISIYFDVWVIPNTDVLEARSELKAYIKKYIESINDTGTNDLFISNLIRCIENDCPYVHHLEFKGINNYTVDYQAIRNTAISLENLSKEERRHFVPEILVVNTNNIFLSIEEVD